MKKISGILITFLLIFILVGCKSQEGLTRKEVKTILTLDQFNVQRRKVNFELKLNDPNEKLKGRSIVAKLMYKEIEVQTTKLEPEKDSDIIIGQFKNLNPDHGYSLEISTTLVVKRKVKSYLLITKDFRTIAEGVTESNPVLINTVEDFLEIGKLDPDEGIVYYRLEEDLDFSEYDPEDGVYTHTFPTSNKFSGVFDGNNKTIKNFVINERKTYLGLFPYNAGTIKNLNIDNALINLSEKNQSRQYIGFISGRNSGKILNVNITNSEIRTGFNLTNKSYIGAVSGRNETGSVIENIYTDTIFNIQTDSKTEFFLGGIVGYIEEGELTNLKSDVVINLEHAYTGNVGGVIGLAKSKTKVNKVTANVTIYVDSRVRNASSNERIEIAIGGVFGKLEDNSEAKNIYSKANIQVDKAINKSNSQTTNDKYLVGGIVGVSASSSNINNALSIPTMTLGKETLEEGVLNFEGFDLVYVGGIAGQMSYTTYEKIFSLDTTIQIYNDFGNYYLSPTVGINSNNKLIDYDNSKITLHKLEYENHIVMIRDEELTALPRDVTPIENYFEEDSFIGELLT